MSARERCVLAYSGGLDTSVAIRWLQEELGYDVITLTADLGESKDVDAVATKALRTGALSAHVADARRVFVDAFCFPTLAAGALYEGVYPLATALGRPLIAKLLVDVAREEGASAVAHGCTGKGNDQVRFDVAVGALAPELRVVAPVRDWAMGRSEELEYAAAHGIEVAVTKASPYSVDANLWGRSIETGVLEDPWIEPPDDVYAWDRSRPCSRRCRRDRLRARGSRYPSTVAGSKGSGWWGSSTPSRGHAASDASTTWRTVWSASSPARCMKHPRRSRSTAHDALESLTIPRDVARFKRIVGDEWARLVYDGLWFSALRTALDASCRRPRCT